MTKISTALWETYLPGKMPDNCTFRMFMSALDAQSRLDDVQSMIDRLAELRELWAGASDKFKQLIELEAKQINRKLGHELS